MKNKVTSTPIALAAMLLFTGCIGLSIGGGAKNQHQNATVGQQLIDLQKAKEAGAITEAEYQSQRSKFLQQN